MKPEAQTGGVQGRCLEGTKPRGFLAKALVLVQVLVLALAHGSRVAADDPGTLVVVGLNGIQAIDGVLGFEMDRLDGGIYWGTNAQYQPFLPGVGAWPQPSGKVPVEVSLATPYVVGTYADGSVAAFGSSVVRAPESLTLRMARNPGPDLAILQKDGTVIQWCPGCVDPDTGQPRPLRPVEGVSGLQSIAAGVGCVVGLREDGTVVAWGLNLAGETHVPPGLSEVVAVGAGYRFAAALRRDGRLVMWGDFPEPPQGLGPLKSFSVGDRCVLALGEDGTVTSWGRANPGILDTPKGLESVRALGTARTASAYLVSPQRPLITLQPTHQMYVAGQTVTLKVAAIGFGTPLRYQWFFNGQPIAGATNETYVGSYLKPRNDGLYTVEVSNAYGSRPSDPARLMITDSEILEQGTMPASMVPRPVLLGPVIGVSVGGTHVVALRSDGTVAAWGNNAAGQCNVPPALRDVVALAAGQQHTLALRKDGTVVAWGGNAAGQCDVPKDLKPVTALAAGVLHSVALQSDGTVRAWGSRGGAEGPTLRAITNAIGICAGVEYSAVLGSDERVTVYAPASFGLMDPPTDLVHPVAIAGGNRHIIVRSADGGIRIWGDNSKSQTNIPFFLRSVRSIAAGGNCSLVQFYDGRVQLIGTGPPLKPILPTFQAMSAGSDVCAFVVPLAPIPEPPQLIQPPRAQRVHVGEEIVLEVEVEGTQPFRYGWYRNGRQIFGTPSVRFPADADSPGLYRVLVSNNYGAFTTEEVRVEVLGIPSGRTYGWGRNLGFPVRSTYDTDSVRSLSVGNNFMVAAKQDGSVVVRGQGGSGQTNLPPGLGRVVSVAAGESHVLALTEQGRVVAWGDNSRGQCDVPATVTDAVAVAAGWFHSLALLSDGTVVGWGDNTHGESRPPAGLRGVVALAAGMDFSLALRRDGRIAAWGGDSQKQVSKAWNGPGVKAIAAGAQHGLAILPDDSVVGWGRNDASQLPSWRSVTNAVFIAAADAYSVAINREGEVLVWGAAPQATPYLAGETRGARWVAAGRYQAVAVLGSAPVESRMEWDGERLRLRSTVSPGWRYQYDESLDLEHWNPSGLPFVAPGPLLSEEVGLGVESVFFRLREVP